MRRRHARSASSPVVKVMMPYCVPGNARERTQYTEKSWQHCTPLDAVRCFVMCTLSYNQAKFIDAKYGDFEKHFEQLTLKLLIEVVFKYIRN